MSKRSRRLDPARPAGGGTSARPAGGPTSTASGGPATTAGPTRPSTSASARRSSRTYRDDRPFLERHRLAVLATIVAVVVIGVGGLVFFQATQKLYACSTMWDPSAGPDASTLGIPQSDMGQTHLQPGTFQRYTLCPPASGPHNTTSQQGPIEPRYYGPDETTVPQGWVHNLEHGALVLLYRCDGSGGGANACDDATQRTLRSFVSTFPNSPVCNLPKQVVGPVVTRFDDMPHPFAALVWDRVLYLDELDLDRVLTFFKDEGERTNPEQQCAAPSPSPGTSASPAPSESPAAGESSVPSVEPSAAASARPS